MIFNNIYDRRVSPPFSVNDFFRISSFDPFVHRMNRRNYTFESDFVVPTMSGGGSSTTKSYPTTTTKTRPTTNGGGSVRVGAGGSGGSGDNRGGSGGGTSVGFTYDEELPQEFIDSMLLEEKKNERTVCEQKLLEQRLTLYGLREKSKIKGDGNCLFASCADHLFKDPEKHPDIRKTVVSWLRQNPNYKLPNQTSLRDYLQTDFFPTWEDYCDYMAQEGTWGDHLTILAIAEAFKTKIVIVSSMEVEPGIDPFTVIVPKSWDRNRIIYLSHLHELHYNSLCVE